MRISLLALASTLAAVALAGPSASQAVAPPARPFQAVVPVAQSVPLPDPASARSLDDAMEAMRRGEWEEAWRDAAAAGPAARDVITWHHLRDGRGDLDEALDFLRRNADWPGLQYLRRQSEEALPLRGRPGEVIAFFGGEPPQTGHGAVALVRAYLDTGARGDAEATAAMAWIGLPMDAEAEAQLLALLPRVLAPLHAGRLDAMLWEGDERAARRAMALVGPGEARLAQARLGLRAGTPGVDALIEAVPAALRDDPGLAYDRFRWRLERGRIDSALELLEAHSASAAGLGRPEAWARPRRDLARRLMREGEVSRAYAVASAHGLAEGSDYADLEWLSGYLALGALDRPGDALTHFRRFRAAVETPISLGRAGYWEGRAHEALGDAPAALQAYLFGAEFQTSFYGLLAAEAAGLPLDPELAGEAAYPPLERSGFADSSVFAAAMLLQQAGEDELAERFLRHLAESLGADDLGTLGDVALALGETHMALMVAKEAAQSGVTLPRAYYPVVDLGVKEMPVPAELALSIARRESEFDPRVVSGAGASGLMQLMPGTARDVARELGVTHEHGRLISDPSYNALLGTTYLSGLIRRFGDNPVLVSAGYNAGPGRPLQWMRERGDPRAERIDVVDWIEQIPFDETRNYVMRVSESIPVYRARLAGEAGRPVPDAPLRFVSELKGR